MSKELMDIVLPRLAKRLDRQLRRYRAGELDDDQFSERFEELLQQQYAWLANQGIPDLDAAVAVHGAVLVLSGPGLRAEAIEQKVPLEVIESRAMSSAADDISQNYGVSAHARLGESAKSLPSTPSNWQTSAFVGLADPSGIACERCNDPSVPAGRQRRKINSYPREIDIPLRARSRSIPPCLIFSAAS